MASIIIPAHDEDDVIRANLETLLTDLDSDNTEVLVVCNGCSDETADEARSVGESVQVIEIARTSQD